jgi:hypothetical protein
MLPSPAPRLLALLMVLGNNALGGAAPAGPPASSTATAAAPEVRPKPAGLPSRARMEAALAEVVSASCPGRFATPDRKPEQLIDPTLERAAHAYLAAVQDGRAAPKAEALEFFASLEGADAWPACAIATVSPAAQADRAVGDLVPKDCAFDALGVAAGLVAPDRALVAVLSAERAVALAPLPGQVGAGEVVRVQGRILRELSRPRLFHLKPTGQVEEVPLLPDREHRFALPVRLAERGEHALELLAEGAGGPEVLALRRIFAGIAAPDRPPPAPPARAGPPDDLAAVETSIAALRAARGLPPLTRDPSLDAVALGHSRAMTRTRTFAHVLPADGSLADRLRRAGYEYASAGENIGLAEDAVHAHAAIARSPAHLANLLDPRHQRLGLGGLGAPSLEGSPAVWLTEVLARPSVRLADPASAVALAIDEERGRRGQTPLRRDPALDAVAQRELAELVRAGQQQPEQALAARALAAAPSARSVVAELFVGGQPDTTAAAGRAADPSWRAYGLDAGYTADADGQQRLWLLLLFAR